MAIPTRPCIEILAASEDHGDFAREWTWADRVANNLALHAISGGYPNLLGPNDHDQIAHAYGPNAARLRAAKARFDPEDVFDAIPLPPEPACDDTNHG
jgi:Berberine and berberine like